MVLPLAAALCSLLAWSTPPEFVPSVDWASDAVEEDDDGERDQLLSGVRLPGLIDTSGLDVGLETFGLYGARGEVTTDANLTLLGDVAHPFEGEISNLAISVGLFEAGRATWVSDRLGQPPLQLTEDDLAQPLPSPLTSTEAIAIAEHVDTGAVAEVDRSTSLGEITIVAEALPEYLLVPHQYELSMPTVADVELILDRGGTADHAALAQWAERFRDEPVPFDESQRSRVMDKVKQRFRRLRAPPALGDYQRLRSTVALIRTMATPGDIENLLRLRRPMQILHTSAMLSYDLALSDESMLDLPVHGMHLVPSRSDFMSAAESAYRSLRPMALEQLLRIAFDPVDFRNAPGSFKKHRLRRQAAAMLEPLRPTDVNGVLAAAQGRLEVQREVLRFYAETRYEPAAEPLVLWLSEHPEEIDELGKLAVDSLPDAVLPAALQHYVDPRDPEHRSAMRKLLSMMPGDRGRTIVESLRSLGVPLTVDETAETSVGLTEALDEFERFERRMASERATALVEALTHVEHDPASLRSALRDVGRLAQLAPEELEAHADTLLELHVAAAMEFDEDAPLERMRALRQLVQLPWGSRAEDANRTHAITQARLSIAREEPSTALDRLLEHDENLSHPEVRELFARTLEDRFESQLSGSQYDAAAATLDSAVEHVPDEVDVEGLRRELSWRRYRPGYFLGAAFGLTLLSVLMWLVVRGSARAVGRWRNARKELQRLARRQADAEANANEAAAFEGEDETVHVTELEPSEPAPDSEEEEDPPKTPEEPESDDPSPDDSDDVPADRDPEPVRSLEPSDDPLDDPLADPFEWDSPFEDDIFSDAPRASGGFE